MKAKNDKLRNRIMRSLDIVCEMTVNDMTICFDEKSNKCYSTVLFGNSQYAAGYTYFMNLKDFLKTHPEIYKRLRKKVKEKFNESFDLYEGVVIIERDYNDSIYREFYSVY